MKLERLTIRRTYQGVIEGSVEYVGTNGAINLTLKDHHLEPVLAAVASALVESSQDVARQLTAEVINNAAALEHKPEPI